MLGQINWSRWALLLLILLMIAISDATFIGRSQVGPAAPILSGGWKLDTGETIKISQDSSGKVTAEFTPHVRCLENSTRKTLFTSPLKITGRGDTAAATLESDEFWACTRTPAMVTECGVLELFQTKFRATVEPSSISGEVLRPHYDFEMVDGRRTNCRRVPGKDGWADFSLTRFCWPNVPWFEKDTSCADARIPVIVTSGTNVSLSICDSEVWRHNYNDEEYLEDFVGALRFRVTLQIGNRVCCQKFRDAVRTGQPCNPARDVDCDGIPNLADASMDERLPDINNYIVPDPPAVASFPQGLDADDPNFLPGSTARASRNVGDCDCKWELIKGVLNCGTGGQQHSYVATWKCPTSGAEVITTKYASANTPCP